MKRCTLLLLFIGAFLFKVNAQCTPMWADTGYGIIPDTITNLPNAAVGMPYDVVVQFKTPATTVYQNSTINIDHVVLTNVDGLSSIPASVPFIFQCNPVDCSFPHDSVRCVRITGTPTTVGTYPLTIDANVYFTPYLFIPFPTTGYRIVVENTIGVPQLNQTGFDVSQNNPNPVTDQTQVYVNLDHPGKITLRISDLVGKEVKNQITDGRKGVNAVFIDTRELASGVYFYSVSNGIQSVTHRMIVDKK